MGKQPPLRGEGNVPMTKGESLYFAGGGKTSIRSNSRARGNRGDEHLKKYTKVASLGKTFGRRGQTPRSKRKRKGLD